MNGLEDAIARVMLMIIAASIAFGAAVAGLIAWLV